MDVDRANDLTAEEIETLVRHMVDRHGLRKVRLTGGDPTARPDLLQIIQRVAGIDGIDDLAMTTNGLSLASRAKDYALAGLQRVNISLDSLDPETFKMMTGVDGLERVQKGIDAALDAGLGPIRLNTVVLRNQNDDQLAGLIEYAASIGSEIRFIEMMPMGPLADRWAEHYMPETEMRQRLEDDFSGWELIAQHHDSARRYKVTTPKGQQAVIGFITPMSCNFCADCNRIRLAADGQIYPCLMDKPAGTLLPAMRPAFDADRFDTIIAEALSHKQPEHPIQGFVTMTHIGG